MKEKIVKMFLDILMITGTVYFFILFIDFINKNEKKDILTLIIIAIFFIGFTSIIFIIMNLRGILTSVIHKKTFIKKNARRIKNISLGCTIISGCYLINMIIGSSGFEMKLIEIDKLGIHTDFDFLIFFMAAIFIYILGIVFDKAVEYKEENDLCV